MTHRLVATLAACGCLVASLAVADDSPAKKAAEAKATATCQDCHGPRGNSTVATFPRLNGQQADYIAAQLKHFRDHSRSDPHAQAYMWGMASQLDDSIIAELGKYYAMQTPTPPQSGGALAGEGVSIMPRLAGQHADYLKKQLEAFRSTLRENDIMHANTKDMTDSQIEALVSYLAND
jgi:cytochrome c553